MHWFFPKPVKTNVVGGPLRNISFFLVPRKWNRRKKLHRSCQGTIFQGYASGRVVFLGSVPGCNVNWSRYFLRYLKWTSFMKSMYIVYSMRGLCVCVRVCVCWKPFRRAFVETSCWENWFSVLKHFGCQLAFHDSARVLGKAFQPAQRQLNVLDLQYQIYHLPLFSEIKNKIHGTPTSWALQAVKVRGDRL